MSSDGGELAQTETNEGGRTVQLAVAAVFILAGGYAFIETWSFPEALSNRDPGPAVIPRYLSLAVVVMGAFVGLGAVRMKTAWEWKLPATPLGMLAIFGAYIALLPAAGYLISTTLFLLAIQFLLRPGHAIASLVFAVVVTAVTFLLFQQLLGIPLWTLT